MVAAKVSRRGQIVIPRAVRMHLNLREGDRVAFVERGEEVVLRPLTRTLLDMRGSVSVNGPQDFDSVRGQVRAVRTRSRSTSGA
jgi:AbrB family looped-hinge helix DNA binding protein